MRRLSALCLLGLIGWTACGTPDAAPETEEPPRPVTFGPADGHELPPADLERVAVGDLAPDFTAATTSGEPITLSSYRGEKNVLLFFYRGHW